MYFPYLYGKEGELRAVTAVAGKLGSPQLILPIVEPVRPVTNLFHQMMRDFEHASDEMYLIVNPTLGTLQASDAVAKWHLDAAPWIAKPVVRPTLALLPTTPISEVSAFAKSNPSRPIGLVVKSSALVAADVKRSLGSANVRVFVVAKAAPLQYITAFGASNVVVINDTFNAQQRNADYDGVELFTEEHLNYPTTGAPGFSDYTPMSAGFTDTTGGEAGAIALHLTYRDNDKIYVQHFVSDVRVQGTGTWATKLLESIDHIHAQRVATPNRFDHTPGIHGVKGFQEQYATRKVTNGAGYKGHQTSHHIITVTRALGIK